MFLYAYYKRDGLLILNIDGTSFDQGEIVNAKVLPVQGLGLIDFSLNIINSSADTLIKDCKKELLTDEYNCAQVMKTPGELTFQAEALMPDGKKVLSNTIQVVVQDENIELKNLTQDKHSLMRIANKTGGNYMHIESLDSMFSHIEITPIQLTKNYQLSGLSLQYYWWIIIFLLAGEWFIRKKLGLL